MVEREILTHEHYEHALECHDCPQTNDESGCPAWIEYADVDKDDDGLIIDERRIAGCFPRVFFKILSESSNRTVLAHNKAEKARGAAVKAQEAAERVSSIFEESRRAMREMVARPVLETNSRQPHGILEPHEVGDIDRGEHP